MSDGLFDYSLGRGARLRGYRRDQRKSINWLRGWDDVQADYEADVAEAKRQDEDDEWGSYE